MSLSAARNEPRFDRRTEPLRVAARPVLLRAALILGCLAAVAVASGFGPSDAYRDADLALAHLLRGMGLIKGGIVLAAVAVLLWRFGRPISIRLASVYLVGAWLAAGASMLIWQLTFIPAAAMGFHLGEITMLVFAWRDGRAEPAA